MEKDKIAKALVGFQADMENVTKDATNPFFKSKYASLEAILTAVKPHLKKHGLAIVQLPEGTSLSTTILHESGQWITGTAILLIKEQTPQGQGSAITYMRRYALCAALGIATEDDDGNEASKPVKAAAAKPDRAVDTQKKLIVNVLKRLGEKVADRSDIMEAVKRLTKLELIEEAYPDIIDRLKTLLEERNSDQ